jgi:hypothetical protein
MMAKTSPNVMSLESRAYPGPNAGTNQRSFPGSDRFFAIFFMQRWGKLNKNDTVPFVKKVLDIFFLFFGRKFLHVRCILHRIFLLVKRSA